jgi:protein-tyrosine phosphatase
VTRPDPAGGPGGTNGEDVVLFLCTGNYYRSRFAEVLFNHLARERGPRWRAESRGLDLAIGVHNVGPISPHTRRACELRNLPLPEPLRGPLALCEDDLRRARLVVAVKEAEHREYLKRLFPHWADRARYWHVHDLDAATADDALAQLERHVSALFDELHSRTDAGCR